MLDPEVAACACVGARAAPGTAAVPAVRDLALRRRRSKIPWMYAVYHAACPTPEAQNAFLGAGFPVRSGVERSQYLQDPADRLRQGSCESAEARAKAEALSHECDCCAWVAEARRSGQSFKSVVNACLRMALNAKKHAAPAPRFSVRTRSLDPVPGVAFDNIEGLLDQLDGATRR